MINLPCDIAAKQINPGPGQDAPLIHRTLET